MPHGNHSAPGHPNWYHCDGKCTPGPRGARYEFPLPEVPNAPVPSQADYSQENVAWLIEFFAGLIGRSHTELVFRYENNTPSLRTDDIFVTHPQDKLYLPEENACNFEKSPALIRYEKFAKKSALLKLYMDHSPAEIEYFQDICGENIPPDPENPPIPPDPPDPPALSNLQELLDLLSPITDLNGLTYEALDIRLHTMHSGMTIQNGIIDLLPDANIGNIKIIQNKWGYPAGVIDLTFKNIIFRGGFDFNYGLQQHNEAQADLAGFSANAITTITYPAGTVTFENCTFEKCGNSAIAGSFANLNIINCDFYRVAKHCVGAREFGGSTVTVNGITCNECGNFLDLHGDSGTLPNPDIAVINSVTVTNTTGRAKISGGNWSVDASNWSFIQDSVINMNMYPAFDLARCPRRFHLTNCYTENYPTSGIGSLGNAGVTGDIVIDDLHVKNSLTGVKVQQVMTVMNSIFEDIHHRYRSGTPTESNNTDVNVKTDLQWAQIYDQIELLFAAKRTEWGTSYPASASYFVPASVLALMETR